MDTIKEVCRLCDNGLVQDAIKALRKHRCTLMDRLHESQERVDCLDFLLWQMEKKSDKLKNQNQCVKKARDL